MLKKNFNFSSIIDDNFIRLWKNMGKWKFQVFLYFGLELISTIKKQEGCMKWNKIHDAGGLTHFMDFLIKKSRRLRLFSRFNFS